jgi:hypothetical protein
MAAHAIHQIPPSAAAPVAPGLQTLPHPAAFCTMQHAKITCELKGSNTRSKFNTALGIEAQGFCALR